MWTGSRPSSDNGKMPVPHESASVSKAGSASVRCLPDFIARRPSGPHNAAMSLRCFVDDLTKMPPVASLLKRAAGLAKASGEPNRNKVGKITLKQAEEIATQKMPDLNTKDLKSALQMVKGTARSMGIEIAE